MDVRYDTAVGQATMDELGLQLMSLGVRLNAEDLGLPTLLAQEIAGYSLGGLQASIGLLVDDIVAITELTNEAVGGIHQRTVGVDQAPGGWPWAERG
jgi:hypothetical protein